MAVHLVITLCYKHAIYLYLFLVNIIIIDSLLFYEYFFQIWYFTSFIHRTATLT